MTIYEITVKMIEYSNGSLRDINHFLKVFAFAKTIGECEKLSEKEQSILEIAALVHDIACPLCREKYGDADGKKQELEGPNLVREFFKDADLPRDVLERVLFLVAHHHTYEGIDGRDYQILLEADYLVNAGESGYSEEHIRNTLNTLFRTKAGIYLLQSIYRVF